MNNKILVTGADGFIGSHLTEYLIQSGFSVKAFVQYNSFNSWGWLDTLDESVLCQVEIIAGDIRDSFFVDLIMKDVKIVFHLAALIAIPFSYYSPLNYFQTNVIGTLNILEASKKFELSRVVITSTSEVYGTALYVPIDEKHPKQPQSPYSASKISSDALGESYYRSFGLPVTIVRPFNTYGPRQSARAVIPTIISQLLSGSEIIKLGEVTATRDLLFVKDTIEGFLKISNCDDLIGQEVNIATQSEISVGDLAQMLITLINPDAKIIIDTSRLRPEKSEVYRLFGSNEKIKFYTDWEQKFSLEEGLKITIDWFSKKENLDKYKTNIYNV